MYKIKIQLNFYILTILTESFWGFIISGTGFVLFFSWNNVLSLARAHFMWHCPILSLAQIIIIFTRSRLVIVNLILCFALDCELIDNFKNNIFTYTFWILSKSIGRAIFSRARFILIFFRDNILSLTGAHFIWYYLFFSLALIPHIFTGSWHIVNILFSWLSLHGELKFSYEIILKTYALTIFAKFFWWWIISWAWLISSFFRYNILSLTLTYFEWNYVVFSLAMILIIFTWSRDIIDILLRRFALNSKLK